MHPPNGPCTAIHPPRIFACHVHATGRTRSIRTRDTACRDILGAENVVEVPDYADPWGWVRHNYEGLAQQRTAALQFCNQQPDVDVIWFVDSDIRVSPNTLWKLLLGIALGADVVCSPYSIRWTPGGRDCVLGYKGADGYHIGTPRWWLPYHACVGCGMGSTVIRLHSERVPRQFTVATVLGVKGEDIGFFLKAQELGATV